MKPLLVDLRDGAMLVEFPGLSDEDANRAAVALGGRVRGNTERRGRDPGGALAPGGL